jgi:hypothetical protein
MSDADMKREIKRLKAEVARLRAELVEARRQLCSELGIPST